MASELFKIIYTGQLSSDADRQQVAEKFSRLFRIDLEKARSIIDRDEPSTLIREAAHGKAYGLKNTLTKLGMQIELARVSSLAYDSSVGLTPVDPNYQEPGIDQHVSYIKCPSCKTEQSHAEICISCGIVFAKFKARKDQDQRANVTETARLTQLSDESRTRSIDTAEMPAYKDDRLPDIRRVIAWIVLGGLAIFTTLYFL